MELEDPRHASPAALLEEPRGVSRVLREEFLRLLHEILNGPQLWSLSLRTEHRLEPGMYHRKITAPAGSLITGRKHRTEHFNQVPHGRALLWTSDTGDVQLVEGPCSFSSPGGTRKMMIVLEDITWVTSHPVSAKTKREAERLAAYPSNYELTEITKFFKELTPCLS